MQHFFCPITTKRSQCALRYFYEVCDSVCLYVPNPIARRLSNGTTALGGQGLANGFLRRRLRLPRFTASHDSTIPMFASAPLPCSLFFLLRATAFHSSLFYVSILLCLLSDSFQSLLISSRSLCNTALSIDTGFTKRATSLQHAVPWRRSTCVSMPTQARL